MIRGLFQAARSLLNARGFTAAFVLTLGLGIGLNTAIFSLVNGVLLAPLPYPDADRILYVRHPAVARGVEDGLFSFLEVEDLRAARSIDEIVEYGDWVFTVVGDQESHRAVGGLVTSNYFEVLGLRARLGRTLMSQDDARGAEPVMVLTHDYWTRVYGADPAVVGRTVRLFAASTVQAPPFPTPPSDTAPTPPPSGGPPDYYLPKMVRVVGVLAPGTHYTGTRRQEFFVNYAANDHYSSATMEDRRTHRMTSVFARLAPGATLEAAAAELASLHTAMMQADPAAYPERMGYAISAARWQDELTAEARPTFLILMGTVVLVLLLTCANVANLTLTRLFRRERELAIRAALGATHAMLRRQLLTENLILSLAGSVLALLITVWSLDLLVQYASRFTVRTGEIGVDVPVLLFTIGVAAAVAILLAWAPSLQGAHGLGSAAGAASSARGVVGLTRKHAQRLLVVSQLALSLTLLIGAGLLVRSLINLTRLDTGIDYENVVTMQVPNIERIPKEHDLQFLEQVMDRIRAFPGVLTVAHATSAPWDPQAGLVARAYKAEGGDEQGIPSPMTHHNVVSPLYFQTVGVNVVRGRTFQPTDDADAEPVVIINERLALDLFGGQDPIGRRIARHFLDGTWSAWLRVVGVAADTREYGLALSGAHTVYLPAPQSEAGPALLVRTTGGAEQLFQHVRQVVAGLDRNRPVDNFATLASLRENDVAPQRLNATLFSAFALLALVIAAIGVFSVLAFNVSQRTQEFGVRMALGARPGDVLALVLGEGALMTGGALALGTVAAHSFSRFLGDFLFGVGPVDPATYAGVAALLAGVALLAAYLPALRATRVDPMQAIRCE